MAIQPTVTIKFMIKHLYVKTNFKMKVWEKKITTIQSKLRRSNCYKVEILKLGQLVIIVVF